MTIEKILDWAWINGLDIDVHSRKYTIPNSFMREAPDCAHSGVFVQYWPCIRFSRDGEHIEVTARNWFDMKMRLKHEYKRIFADLRCRPMEEDSRNDEDAK